MGDRLAEDCSRCVDVMSARRVKRNSRYPGAVRGAVVDHMDSCGCSGAVTRML